eukprot:TRINITY_DN91119_c0_g1_i1.p1 TRINITY_DN91119_c0_g1~~TRINITY_DN91119_c0_g1_i1.p1  ORF type:complete len:238 (+),score=55.86 TRINITY_DN91119_c0_g1_i1:89-802(+)
MGTVIREARAALQAAGESSGEGQTWQRPVLGAGARRRSGSASGGSRVTLRPLLQSPRARSEAGDMVRPPPGRPPSRGPPRSRGGVRPNSGPSSLVPPSAARPPVPPPEGHLQELAGEEGGQNYGDTFDSQEVEAVLRELEVFSVLIGEEATALSEIASSEVALQELFEASRSEARQLSNDLAELETVAAGGLEASSMEEKTLAEQLARARQAMGLPAVEAASSALPPPETADPPPAG